MNPVKIDYYTKSILTLIAICLMALTLKNLDFFPKAYAGKTVSELDFPHTKYGLVPLNEDGSITVKLSSAQKDLDVNIVGIKTYDKMDVNIEGIDTHDKMNVNIKEVGGYSTYGRLPVEIEN